ncbi:pentatricopeptide repeat-containing protein At4g20740-like [Mercurialis annua]|uniref:pentatricopeptide repeat-containing protein At4g20740-like n=1 Tax=Mercurialis annua TaxID=3986 RepID=UPI0024ACDEA8|nr:pentatricopeptide repeat-containing protein At4g20740-like [Mercurialis annua]
MGNWRNRRRVRYQHYKDPSSSYYNHHQPSHHYPGFAEDGVPIWEKKFCSSIGSVPWQKIVNAKKFLYCHDTVMRWDDSASEDAFQKAKKRFWSEINRLPSEISLPDPDMFIDPINWHPDIDPELVKDLELAFFTPDDEGENDGSVEHKNKKNKNSVSISSEGWNGKEDEVRTPWECENKTGIVDLKDKIQDWNRWHTSTNNSSHLNNSDTPWGNRSPQGNEALESKTWGTNGDISQGWTQSVNSVNEAKDWDNCNLNNDGSPWDCRYPQGNASNGGGSSNKLWGRNHSGNQFNQSKEWNNNGGNPWKSSSQSFGPAKDKAWGYCNDRSWSTNKQELSINASQSNFSQGGGNRKDRQWRGNGNNPYREPNDMELRQQGGGWRTWDGDGDGHRRQESSHLHAAGNKQTRFQGNDFPASNRWNGGATKKRVSFAYDYNLPPEMPPQPPPPKPHKPYFFYGHRKPSRNRPVVRGGLFTNRQTINSHNSTKPSTNLAPFDLQKWDPQNSSPPKSPSLSQNNSLSALSQRLSPICRYIRDAFRKNSNHWGPPVVTELRKLRRVTPDLVAEVLKVETNPHLASKFFHWAGTQKGYQHNFASYNAFAYCLNRNSFYRAADQLPELMDSQGKPPSEKQFEILIRMHSDANRGLRVYYVYQKMKKFGVKPRAFLYNRIMDALFKTGHLDLGLLVYDDFKSGGLVEDSVTYMILIKGLCKVGRIEEMMEVLGRMRTNLCKPDVFAYTAMVRLLVGEGNLDGCLRVWEEMKRDRVDPDVMAYVTLITGLSKGGRVVKAYQLFKEMKEKKILIDRAIYGVLIEAFVGDGKVGSACDLLKDLVDSGYRADLDIYNSLIEGLCNVKRVDKAYKLFQVMVEEGLEPDFRTLNPMLTCYAELKNMDDFSKLLVQMDRLGFSVKDDMSKFFSFLVGKEERTAIALEVFEDLKTKGYASVSVYNVLMEALLKRNEVKKALSLFEEMKDLNIEPDSISFSIAIICFVEDGNIQEACACHNKIIEMSSFPSIAAYCSLTKGLCDIGEIDEAMMLVRDCLGNVTSGPMEFKYALTILHACRSNDAEKVIEVVNEMMQEGCRPNEVICCAILSGMCKHGTTEEARKVFVSLKERKLLTEAKTIVYDEMLIEHLKKKTADLVVSGLKFFGLESKLRAKGSTLLST